MPNLHTYITVHDQDIIVEFEKHKKFKKELGNDYTYLFVGQKEVDKLYDFKNKVIICRDLKYNIEQHKNLVSYTSWYALVKNNLLKHDYNLMLEYDVLLCPAFYKKISEIIKQKQNTPVFSFIAEEKCYQFDEYIKPLLSVLGIEEEFYIKREAHMGKTGVFHWCGSNNILFKKDCLKNFVEWFEKSVTPELLSYDKIGHTVERAMTVYFILNNIKYEFILSPIKHYYLNSHQTSNAYPDGSMRNYLNHIKELAQK